MSEISSLINIHHLTPWGQALLLERDRQVSQEGWTAEHDAQHEQGDLLAAANCYYLHAVGEWPLPIHADGCPVGWPWERAWWKPKSKWRDLVRAGALCLAERDLLRSRDPSAYIGHVNSKLGLILRALEAVPEGERK
jgi:hypothetical protein